MPENTMRIDRHMPGNRLDRLVTQEDPHEQHDRTAEQGDPPPHARGGQLPRREQRLDARMRAHPVRHRERMVDPPLPGHVPAWRHAGGSELIIVPWTAMIQSAQSFGHYRSPDATAIHKRDNFWSDLQICHI